MGKKEGRKKNCGGNSGRGIRSILKKETTGDYTGCKGRDGKKEGKTIHMAGLPQVEKNWGRGILALLLT